MMFSNNLMGLLMKFEVDLVLWLSGLMLGLLVICLLEDWHICAFFNFLRFVLSKDLLFFLLVVLDLRMLRLGLMMGLMSRFLYFLRSRMQDCNPFFLSLNKLFRRFLFNNWKNCFHFRLGIFLSMGAMSLVVDSMVQNGFRLNFFKSSNDVMNLNGQFLNLVRNMGLFFCFIWRNRRMRKLVIIYWVLVVV